MLSGRFVLIIGVMMVVGLVSLGCQPVRPVAELPASETTDMSAADELGLSEFEVNLDALKWNSYVASGIVTHTQYADLIGWCAPTAEVDFDRITSGIDSTDLIDDIYQNALYDYCQPDKMVEWIEKYYQEQKNRNVTQQKKQPSPYVIFANPVRFTFARMVSGDPNMRRGEATPSVNHGLVFRQKLVREMP